MKGGREACVALADSPSGGAKGRQETPIDFSYLIGYTLSVVYVVKQTGTFIAWHQRLKDRMARIAIARRLENVEAGTLGDVKSVGGGVSELRVKVGPGYRLYFTKRESVVVLLCGGHKGTQDADIRQARKIAKEIET